LHKPTRLGVVRLNGRDIYLGRHGTPESRAEYQRVIAQWIAGGGHLRTLRSSLTPATAVDERVVLSVDELILAYLEFAKGYYVKNREQTDEVQNVRDALKPLATLYSTTSVAEFGPSPLKAVRQNMLERGWCRTYTNAQTNRIRRVFKWGVENELVAPTVLHGLQAVAPLRRGRGDVRESQPVKPVPDSLLEPVLKQVPSQVAAMIRLQLLTRMRPSEVLMMRTCDIDVSGKPWTYRPTSHKTEHHGRLRVIYLGPRAQAVLRPFLKCDVHAWLFSPTDAMEELWTARRQRRQAALARAPGPQNRAAFLQSAKVGLAGFSSFTYTVLLGDATGDGWVDSADEKALLAAWGSTPRSKSWNERADLNWDGVVDDTDLKILRKALEQEVEVAPQHDEVSVVPSSSSVHSGE